MLLKYFDKFFHKGKADDISYITCGERDENGFCDTYVNGIKTNVRMLVFTSDEVEKIEKVQKELYGRIL